MKNTRTKKQTKRVQKEKRKNEGNLPYFSFLQVSCFHADGTLHHFTTHFTLLLYSSHIVHHTDSLAAHGVETFDALRPICTSKACILRIYCLSSCFYTTGSSELLSTGFNILDSVSATTLIDYKSTPYQASFFLLLHSLLIPADLQINYSCDTNQLPKSWHPNVPHFYWPGSCLFYITSFKFLSSVFVRLNLSYYTRLVCCHLVYSTDTAWLFSKVFRIFRLIDHQEDVQQLLLLFSRWLYHITMEQQNYQVQFYSSTQPIHSTMLCLLRQLQVWR